MTYAAVYTEKLVKFIAEHGFEGQVLAGGQIKIAIPTTDASGAYIDPTVFVVPPTLSAVREALGY